MKIVIPSSIRTARLLSILAVIGTLLAGSAAWGVVFPDPVPTAPLSLIPVPEPPNLYQFVKDKPAAIRLGRALYWDMQVGSDGVTACASCHAYAGADNRMKNTLHPGPDTQFGNNTLGVEGFPQFGPNYTLQPEDFPFHRRQDPVDFQASLPVRDTNDIVGSQGIRKTDFMYINIGSSVETGTVISDPTFSFNGNNVRQVTGRNTPTVINAVFNYANFWDGRANNIFNGENPFGQADKNAGAWFNENGALVKRPVLIRNASLASQAVGPPLSDVEMSFKGRTFPEIGKKMLHLTPLGRQMVHPNESILGPYSRGVLQPDGSISGDKGLNISYEQMITDAFVSNLTSTTLTALISTVSGTQQFNQMEANFSLFFGLAVQLYEATLVADQTPLDSFLAGDQNALNDQQKLGFNIFFGAGRCGECHGGTELTVASVSHSEFLNNSLNELVQFMFSGNSLPAIYDNGFYNIGARPTTDDPGRGGTAPFGNPLTGENFPLSFSRLAELQATGNMPFATPVLPPLVSPNIQTAVDGAFKTPGLRNIELTAPYFHNGGALTIDEVVEQYNRGGNFPMANIDNMHPAIGQIDLLQFTTDRDAALVAFLHALTDERVRNESAPFDHPELFIPNGDPEVLIRLPARGANGNVDTTGFTLNPVTSLTHLAVQTISGTIATGLTPTVTVNTAAAVGPVTVSVNTWSATITGLAEGANSIVASAQTGTVITQLQATITVDTVYPDLTLNVTTPIIDDDQTITGTVEPGLIPMVNVNTAARVGPVSISGNTWSCRLDGLFAGVNNITVTAVDRAGNPSVRTAAIIRNTLPRDLHLDAVVARTRTAGLTISGTVDGGAVPVVTVDSGALVGPVMVNGNSWSCRLMGLKTGDNTITVTAVNAAGSAVSVTARVQVLIADGCFRGTGSPDVSDALKALRMAVGIIATTPDDLSHGDVTIDGRVDSGDALLILRKAVGLTAF